MKPLLIYGASYPDVIKLIDSINDCKATWEITGFLDDVKKKGADSFLGIPILGGEEVIDYYQKKNCFFINNVFSATKHRFSVTEKLDSFKVKYATLISPKIDIRYTKIGYDCMIMEGVTLGVNTRIGNHVGIRLNTSINHESNIESHTFIGPGATICGRVTVEKGCYIGAGAVINAGLTIHQWSMIGMGAVVNQNVAEGDVVASAPARSVKHFLKSS